MATIRIQRTIEYQNAFRKINIFIDGEKVGIIENGKAIDFTVKTGNHTIVAKIDWCSSQKLNIQCRENTINSVQLSGYNMSIFLTLYYLSFSRNKYLKLTEINQHK